MNILDKIIAHKRIEVAEKKELIPVKLLERSIHFGAPAVSLSKYLRREDKTGIIAEFKRMSPSKGMINEHANVERTSIGYMQAGASALSILTDRHFFGGSNEDLSLARKFNFCPILRKDFVVDEYQVIEAKSIGADAVLLLANVLGKQEIMGLAKLAHSLGMEVLLEIREKDELASINDYTDMVGVNNRDLKTFSVDVTRSFGIGALIPDHLVRISESGIDSPETIGRLRDTGFNGFLIGERFMNNSRPERACAQFIKEIKAIKKAQYDRI
jgi:indole-3-glycerol phosphate synthase